MGGRVYSCFACVYGYVKTEFPFLIQKEFEDGLPNIFIKDVERRA